MPIHLAPIARREFLKRVLTAGAGAALAPELLAARKPVDAHAWALFSDIHLAADRVLKARGINMADHFQAAARELVALPKRPQGLFITGDCAYNSGQLGDYAVVADLLDPIRLAGLPVHLALGNHDNRERFWEAFPAQQKAQRPLVDRQVALVQSRRVNWLILDSLEQTLSTPGLLGPEQLQWLARTLDAHQRKPAIVMVHHNPGVLNEIPGLKDTTAFLEVLRPRRQVKACIYGHTHFWKVTTEASGLHLVNLPPVAYVFQDGKPSGWVHATVEREALKLELRCIDPTHPEQGQKMELEWRKA